MANYDRGADWNGQDGNVTTVGGTLSLSFYFTEIQDRSCLVATPGLQKFNPHTNSYCLIVSVNG